MRALLGLCTLLVLGCDPVAPRAPASPPATTQPPLPLPGDVGDASLDLAPAATDAGPRSDCLPNVPNDGSADLALPRVASDRLALCVKYATSTPEAHNGRVCYEMSLTSGVFGRVPPIAGAAPDVLASLAEHASAAADGVVVRSAPAEVRACKGDDCAVIKPEGFHPLKPAANESCIAAAVRQAIPADVSPDGKTMFLVRHESCTSGLKDYGEIYDLRQKRRTTRALLRVDGAINQVAWIGARLLLRDCNEEATACSVSLLDPAAPPTATTGPHSSWNGPALKDLNPGALEQFAFRAKDDLWALVDRTGGSVAYLHADSGKVERTVTLAAAPDLPRPLLVVRRPPGEIVLFYGGSARVVRFDLAKGEAVARFLPPLCGGDR